MCKCTPRTGSAPEPEQESIFRTVFAGWLKFGGIFRWSLRATTKKRSSTFLVKKLFPQTKSWLRLCCRYFVISFSAVLHAGLSLYSERVIRNLLIFHRPRFVKYRPTLQKFNQSLAKIMMTSSERNYYQMATYIHRSASIIIALS